VANMTGNVVFLAFSLTGAPGFSLIASLVAIGAFSVGALVGGRVSKAFSPHRGHMLGAVGVVEAVLLAIAAIVGLVIHNPAGGVGRYVLITVLSLAMGAQNAMARKLAVPDLTTTVLTLTLTGISADSRLAGGGGSKAGRRLVSASSMFIGALIGAMLVVKVSRVAATFVALAILCVVAAVATLLSRSDPPWARSPT